MTVIRTGLHLRKRDIKMHSNPVTVPLFREEKEGVRSYIKPEMGYLYNLTLQSLKILLLTECGKHDF